MANLDMPELSIGEVARRTGVPVATLRMWEARYGFPLPHRRGSGHRRYTERDCVLLREVKRERAAGVSVMAAIEHATRRAELAEASIAAGVRLRHPELEPTVLPEPFMLAISLAIEQEALTHGKDAVLIGCFQRRRAWSRAQHRWRDLAALGHVALVFADFTEAGSQDGIWTVPIAPGSTLATEWAVICDGPDGSACVLGTELLRPLPARRFEAVWSVDPTVVRDAARAALALAVHDHPHLASVAGRLSRRAATPPKALQQASALTNRVIVNALHIGRASTRR